MLRACAGMTALKRSVVSKLFWTEALGVDQLDIQATSVSFQVNWRRGHEPSVNPEPQLQHSVQLVPV